jgi:hypothetical protein
MMQTKRIFLASSSDLKEERTEFEIFIYRKNKDWVTQGVFIDLINAATLLYHAAIAAAYAQHGVNVSSRPIETRRDLYEDLGNAFTGAMLGDVFRQAVDRAIGWGAEFP